MREMIGQQLQESSGSSTLDFLEYGDYAWFRQGFHDQIEAYVPLLVFLGLGIVIGCALVFLSFVRGQRRPDAEKLSAYECGFEPIGPVRAPFHVRFYLVSILFIVFDIEVALLFPWAVALRTCGVEGLVSVGIFLTILGVGFFYEWRKGALEWE